MDETAYQQLERPLAAVLVLAMPSMRPAGLTRQFWFWLGFAAITAAIGGLPDIDAKLEQFAVDPRCSPKRVRDAHVANELANVRRCLWSATARSGFPAPIGSEASTVPADHCLRLENFQCVQYSRSHTIERS